MAVNEQLKVSFIGEDGNLSKTLGQLEEQLKRFTKATKEVGNVESLNRLNRAIDVTKSRIEAIKKLGSPLPASFGKTTVDATQALGNLSRVAQDAPFGFMGIANNLNPLLESFQRLKVESKAAGQSLSSVLVKSLTGAGGLGLALGVVSSALTIFSVGFGAWTRGFKDGKKSVEDVRDALDKYAQSLDDVRGAQLAGAQDAQKELTSLKTLYEATQNANIPLEKRRQLVDELQKQYPKYFKNISDETILAGGARNAYNSLATAILAAAKARAGQDAIVDIQKQVLTQEEKIVDAAKAESEAWDKVVKARKLVNALASLSPAEQAKESTAFRILNATTALNDAEQKYKESIRESTAALGTKNRLLERAEKIADQVSTVVETDPNALLNPGGGVPEVKTKEVKIVPERFTLERIKGLEFEGGTGNYFADLNKQIAEALKPTELQKYVTNLWKGKQVALPIPIVGKPEVKIEADGITKAINDSITAALKGVTVEGLSSFGEAIGNVLSGGGIGDAFKGFGEFLGNAIQGIGKQMIALSPLIAGIQAAIKSFNPALLLPAGIALTALGGVIKNMFASSLPGFKSGLDSVPYDDFVARLHKGEMVLTAGEAKQYRAMERPQRNNIFNTMAAPEMMQPQVIVIGQGLKGNDAVLQQIRANKKIRRGA